MPINVKVLILKTAIQIASGFLKYIAFIHKMWVQAATGKEKVTDTGMMMGW